MLNLGPEKVLLVLVIALVVLGPNRLPQVARTLGRTLANLRRLSGSLQSEFRQAVSEPGDALRSTVSDLGLGEVRESLRQIANPLAAPRPAAPTPPAYPPVQADQTSALPPPPDDPSLN